MQDTGNRPRVTVPGANEVERLAMRLQCVSARVDLITKLHELRMQKTGDRATSYILEAINEAREIYESIGIPWEVDF